MTGWENVWNLIFLVAGLAIGLLSGRENQRSFLARQQEQLDQIAADLSDLRAHLTSLAQATTERAYGREERPVGITIDSDLVDRATEQAASEIRATVVDELQRAGVPNALERPADLKDSVGRIMAQSVERVIEDHLDLLLTRTLASLDSTERLVLRSLSEGPVHAADVVRALVAMRAQYPDRAAEPVADALLDKWFHLQLLDRSEDGFRLKDGVRRVLPKFDIVDRFYRAPGPSPIEDVLGELPRASST